MKINQSVNKFVIRLVIFISESECFVLLRCSKWLADKGKIIHLSFQWLGPFDVFRWWEYTGNTCQSHFSDKTSETYKDHHLKDPSSCISSEQLDQTWAADPTPPKMRPTCHQSKQTATLQILVAETFSFCPFLGWVVMWVGGSAEQWAGRNQTPPSNGR